MSVCFFLLLDIDDFAPALESAFTGKATVLYRMRLSCTFHDSDGNRIGKANDGESVDRLRLINNLKNMSYN